MIFIKNFMYTGGLAGLNTITYTIPSNTYVQIYNHIDVSGTPINTVICDLTDYTVSECTIDYAVHVNSINGTAGIFSSG